MYKLLKPLPQAFQAMLVEFQRYITDTGLDQVKSLHTENVSFDYFPQGVILLKKDVEILHFDINLLNASVVLI